MDGILSRKGVFDQIPPGQRRDVLRFAPEMKLEMLADPRYYLPTPTDEEIARISLPTLLVSGDRSPILFGLITDELARWLHNNERVTISNAGHSMHSANPDEYNQKVLEFLAKHA